MPEYNKLVRDGIPEIIAGEGLTAVTRILSNTEYESALVDKILEEAKEVAQADTTEAMEEELADLREATKALIKHISSEERVEAIRVDKATKRGSFEKRIFLEKVED